MKKRPRSALPVYWIRWRRRRYQSLAAQGLSSHLAWDVAAAEAKHRHSIGKIIGLEAARDAKIVAIDNKFALMGNTGNLTDSQMQAITSLNSRAMPKAA